MKVGELIDLLRTFPHDAVVVVLADEGTNEESFPYQVFDDDGRVVIDTSFAEDETDQPEPGAAN